MRVKKFVSETLQDAMLKVKMDMGKDAVILHTRKYKEGGFFGFFGKQMFEVTAAVDDGANSVKGPQKNPSGATVSMPSTVSAPAAVSAEAEAALQKLKAVNAAPPSSAADSSAAESDKEDKFQGIAELHDEILEMKELINDMKVQFEASEDIKNLPPALQKYHQILTDNEVDHQLAKDILKEILAQNPKLNDQEIVEDLVLQQIQRHLKRPKPISFKRQGLKHQSIALVGPTGVGKTTTIAKLAATFSIVDKKNVALITADTYRVAAVEQLKTYGEIIGVPVDVVFSPAELQEAVNRHLDKDLILIDTAGRSHKNEEQMDELKSFLDVAEPSDIFLVLSATTRYKDMMEIVDRYADIPINRLIFTKLDETSCVGAILNIVAKTQKSLSYVTVGQNVPDDIAVADPAEIAKLIAKER